MSRLDAARLQRQLDDIRKGLGIPGLSACIHLEGEVVECVSGVLDCETAAPVRPESVFLVGSVTKPITATLVMLAQAEGRLDLDMPVSEALGGMSVAGTAGEKISVKQLLCHTSGLDGDVFEDMGDEDDCLVRYAALAHHFTQVCPPGRYFNYCNAGYVLLGRIAERALNGRYDELVRTRILGPLDISGATADAGEAMFRAPAHGHVRVDGRIKRADAARLPRALGPAGFTLRASARDLAIFGGAHIPSEGSVFDHEMIRAMQDAHVCLPDGAEWTFGWKRIVSNDVVFIGHDGGVADQCSWLWLAPKQKCVVSLCANMVSGEAFRQFAGPVFQELCGASPVPEPPGGAGLQGLRDGVQYEGVYRNAGVNIEVRQISGELHCRADIRGGGKIDFTMRALGGERFLAMIHDDPVITAFHEFDAAGRPHLFFAGRMHVRADLAS